jgi:hypothetical protein
VGTVGFLLTETYMHGEWRVIPLHCAPSNARSENDFGGTLRNFYLYSVFVLLSWPTLIGRSFESDVKIIVSKFSFGG